MTCRLIRISSTGRRPKPQSIAASRRKEREVKEEEKKEVEAACNTILNASRDAIQPSKKLKLVATSIIKSVMESVGDRVELPTGGPVSMIQSDKIVI
jgi:hypothetical protein